VHDEPEKAVCDGQQALTPDRFDALMVELRMIAKVLGRSI